MIKYTKEMRKYEKRRKQTRQIQRKTALEIYFWKLKNK